MPSPSISSWSTSASRCTGSGDDSTTCLILPSPPQRESFEDAVARLKARGATGSKTWQRRWMTLRLSSFSPLTLPSRPATHLRKHIQVAECLAALDPSHHDEERETLIRRLHQTRALLWQTEEIRRRPPEVLDEVKSALFYVENTLFEQVPALFTRSERVLRRAYPEKDWHPRAFLRFASWIGGDADGNPLVTVSVTKETLLLQKSLAIRLYRDAVKRLATQFRPDDRLAQGSARLSASLTHDCQLCRALPN